MDNLILLPKNQEFEELSAKLGFSRTLFLETDAVIIEAKTKKELLLKTNRAVSKKLLTLYKPPTEDLLRFALEKTPISMVLGIEHIHPKESTHFVRGGLDQILCKIAAEKDKIIAFSFSDILNSPQRSKLLARMMFNIKLCKKYKVKVFFSNFSMEQMEMRSARDLLSFWNVLGGAGKGCLEIQKQS